MPTARTVGVQSVTDGTSNTEPVERDVDAAGRTAVAGTGKNFENRVFFNANAPNATPTPAGVLQFLAACRNIPPGTRPRARRWAISGGVPSPAM